MTRSHCLLMWSVVFGFLTAASLNAADKEKKSPKPPAEKPEALQVADPFGAGPAPAKPSAKRPPKLAAKDVPRHGGEAAIEEALASPTEVVFVEASLDEVINSLRERHHIEIKIDIRALSDVGIGFNTPVTVDLKGISLRSALNLMLKELSLTWMIQDEVLLITTPEVAENELSTKLYDVADLVTCRDEHDAPWEDYDTLIDIIASTIKPTTWDMVGGQGSINGATLGTAKVLVASQTREVHEQIADLLAKIRAIAKKNLNAGVPRRNKPIGEKAPRAQAQPLCEGYPGPAAAPPSSAPKSPDNTPAPVQPKQPPKP